MKIKTNYNALVSIITLMDSVVSTKNIQDDMQVMNIFVKDGKLHAMATDSQLFCMQVFDGEYDLEGETNPFMVIRLKEISDILSKYASLQRTEVKDITLETHQKGIIMTVEEEAKKVNDNGFDFTSMFKNQEIRYKLVRQDVKTLVSRELPTMIMPDNYIEVKSRDLQKYLEYMHTPMTKPKEPAVMHFDNEFVCSIMGNVYGVAMPNNLPQEIFTGLSLPISYVTFLKKIIPMEDTFKIYKDVEVKRLSDKEGDEDWNIRRLITLYIEIGSILVKLRVADTTKGIATKTFKKTFENTIEVDKPYFLDSLKRLSDSDQVFLEITITEDPYVTGRSNAEFIVKTHTNRQRIPVKCAHGSGEFKFMMRPESIELIAFKHLTKDLDGNSDKVNDLIFCLDNTEKDMVEIGCRDKTDDWQTRFPRAPHKVAPQLDF